MEIDRTTSFVLIGLMAAVILSIVVYLNLTFPEYVPVHMPFIQKILDGGEEPGPENTKEPVSLVKSIQRFASEEEFKEYLAKSEDYYGGWGGFGGGIRSGMAPVVPLTMTSQGKGGIMESDASAPAGRVSETNVQVQGIDEPDIVKTNGSEIFYSNAHSYWYGAKGGVVSTEMDRVIPGMPPYEQGEGTTKIISAFPPESLALANELKKGGELLLKGDILTIFRNDKIYGFDISDTSSPKEKWSMDIEENNYIVSSRLYNGKIYLVLQKWIDVYNPCPIRPLVMEGGSLEIRCADIYHPVQPVPVDTVYTAVIISPDSGEVEKKISFTGYSGSSLLYMSEKNLYLTYTYFADFFPIFVGFFTGEMRDLLPGDLIKKLEKLAGYDISSQSKITELQTLLENYDRGLGNDERLKLENETANRMESYFKKHAREMQYTGIVKISLDTFNVLANEKVPGMLLNQFSLDEYKDHLRIATTIGDGFWGFSLESANDVYVLDKNLKVAGFVRDLGLTERIYSARFVGDRGYVVTFRETDPFYVLDLSVPQNPKLAGELKIPGYSSYLHPVSESKILGIGKEGSKVKISLFDVSSASNPTEASKYTLDEYWSEILNTYHAFLMDKKHEVFFLPGSKGGYVFSYTGDQLKLVKAVSGIYPRRAIYLDDYLYILADNELVVLNENNWERVNGLKF